MRESSNTFPKPTSPKPLRLKQVKNAQSSQARRRRFLGMQDCRKRLASVGWISSCTVIYHSAVLHLYFELMTSKTVACLKYWFVWLVCNGRILRQSYEI